ncbi:release factor [Eremomyces bilateralis CBS 781.70]|uniref:Release factor n=1 Tax=Eremomyces bilateralis CBS 781.70 TaxID=1392243 RepID=A0A6G1FQP8_9PEZI|nr:release factor [Eremomyces bilateralis CBS 781.70]KAF1808114.1 release factor [Eremomyces bilateralis CBS 781.70]
MKGVTTLRWLKYSHTVPVRVSRGVEIPRLWRQARQRCPRPYNIQQLRYSSSPRTPSTNPSISPILLTRASSLVSEHARLTTQLSASYDLPTAKRVGELTPIASALTSYQSAHEAVTTLDSFLSDPTTDPELLPLAEADLPDAINDFKTSTTALLASLLPPHPFGNLPCLLEIRPGAGGQEAFLFAGDLFRMYKAYCSAHNLPCTVLKYETADGISDPNGAEAPLQEGVIEIGQEGAYGLLRTEAGVHRVQRVPATEAKGRTHTSSAAVMVLPSFPATSTGEEGAIDVNDPNSDYYVDPKEVRTDIMRASGAGGQHVNKTESAVRLLHGPTGIVVSMQDSRSQHQNREKAWQVMRARIAEKRREAREEEEARLRSSVIGVAKVGREHKVRTYNWQQRRVTDHRSGWSEQRLGSVLEGGEGLEDCMKSVRGWMIEREVEALVAMDEAQEKGKTKTKSKSKSK